MRPVWISLAVIVAAVLAAYLAGSLLPREHTASANRTISAPPDQVFEIITGFADTPSWRTGVKSVRVEADGSRYVEESSHGTIPYRVIERIPNARIVTEIDSADLPFGGRWIFELEQQPEGTRVSITENGFVGPPLFRLLSRFVFGHETTMRQYLDDLEKRVRAKTV